MVCSNIVCRYHVCIYIKRVIIYTYINKFTKMENNEKKKESLKLPLLINTSRNFLDR